MNGEKALERNRQLNLLLRKNAVASLFPILRDLGIQAALSHKAAFALHENSLNAPKEIRVVVGHKPDLILEDLYRHVVSYDQSHFSIESGKHPHLRHDSKDPRAKGKACRVYFIQSGGALPTLLEDFATVVRIADTPVLPLHAILLEGIVAQSLLQPPRPLGKGVANLIHKWLIATDCTPLEQFSPLWQSPEILAQIAHHASKVPDTEEQWIARGIDRCIFAASPSATAYEQQAQAPILSGDSEDDDEGVGPDANSLVGPPDVAAPPLNVVIPPGYTVIDIAARQVVSILGGLGFNLCAIVGSAASKLYSHGEAREPEKLDVLVLPPVPFSQGQACQWLKQQIFLKDPIQFEYNSKKGKLSYKIDPSIVLPRRSRGNSRKCKVEILLPGAMGLSYLSPHDIIWIDDLPVVPFLTLLLSKLDLWPHYSKGALARDVKQLLLLVPNLPVSVFRPWRERKLMSEEAQAASEGRVKRFCSTLPETIPTWQMLGFDVENVM
ncbi:hypothetical protein EST38_g12206 [Candolleomyces aberdarensis]|uniref:Uncharacterized protein n=1 Tax=Candolleomyces aberdarensis TaxID=2316362 RepID=A0A4Q2D2Y9_9AGAR|nr:hypothetical protein EST38_g12206 [Candolleomyces aberdarensis]